MNKFSKIILITLLAVFGFGLLSINPAWASGVLEISWGDEPLFTEPNFLPGQKASAEVGIKNVSGAKQEIAVRTSIEDDPDNLTSQLLFFVKDGDEKDCGTVAALANNADNWCKFGEIEAGQEKEFFFEILFNPEAGNEYKNTSATFDIRIGAGVSDNGIDEVAPPLTVMGGGGFLPLTIFNEKEEGIDENSATITWNTNRLALGRIIYDTRPGQFNLALGDPAYGYAFFSPKTTIKDTFHSVKLFGLTPGTTYYYRIVAYGSLAISKPFSFTTAGVMGEEIVFEPSVFPPPFIPDVLAEEIEREEIDWEETEGEEIEEESFLEETIILQEEMEAEPEAKVSLCWLLLLIIIILIILSLLYMKKKQARKKWILPVLTLIAAILYYFLCCLNCWILILAAVILLILSLIFGQKKKELVSQEAI